MCLNSHSRSPATAETSCSCTIVRRSSEPSRSSGASLRSSSRAAALDQNVRPATDACCARWRSDAGRPSRRAATSAWRLSGVGSDSSCGRIERLRVEQHLHRLLEEERVAVRVPHEPLERRALEPSLDQRVDETGDERVALVLGQGAERDHARGCSPETSSCGMRVAELGPRRGEDEQRRLGGEEREHQLDQRRLGPVDVLEHEHQRALRRQQLEEPADTPVQLGLRDLRGHVRAARRRRCADEVGRVPTRSSAAGRRPSMGSRSISASSFVETTGPPRLRPGSRRPPHDLRHRPVGDPLAVRQARAPVHLAPRPPGPPPR